jgi:hypothetical protein
MLKLEGLGIETKAGLLFGVTGFVLSFITGFVSGVSFSVVIIRSVITVLVFSGIGFAVLMILKKFVPEMYEILASSGNSEEAAVHEPDLNRSERYSDNNGLSESLDDETPSSEFREMDDQSYERLTSVEDQGLNSELNVSEGKMGKHIIMQDEFNGYEPKLIADAVRTMMSKDKE